MAGEKRTTNDMDDLTDDGNAMHDDADHVASFNLSEEELIAHTRDAEQGRVVIRKRVETVPYEVPVDVRHDDIEIERVVMDVDIDEPPGVRQEGETTIVPVVVEALVVEKRLRLVEEVRITKRRMLDQEMVREELRREVVEVEEINDAESPRRD